MLFALVYSFKLYNGLSIYATHVSQLAITIDGEKRIVFYTTESFETSGYESDYNDELGDAKLPRFQKSKLIEPDASHHPEVLKCLLQAGFEYSVARQLTEHELRFWNVQELNQTLGLVDATVDDIRFRRLKSFEVVPSLPSRIGHGRVHFNSSDFVKPRWKQI